MSCEVKVEGSMLGKRYRRTGRASSIKGTAANVNDRDGAVVEAGGNVQEAKSRHAHALTYNDDYEWHELEQIARTAHQLLLLAARESFAIEQTPDDFPSEFKFGFKEFEAGPVPKQSSEGGRRQEGGGGGGGGKNSVFSEL